jgi:deoxycytidylate deaminase
MLSVYDIEDTMDSIQECANETSSDSERKVGVELRTKVDKKYHLVSSNTFVDGAKGLPSTAPDKYEFMVHAEVNALLYAAKRGIAVDGGVVLSTLSPCPNCLRSLFQAGIREVYWKDKHSTYRNDLRDIKITETTIGIYTHMKLENY